MVVPRRWMLHTRNGLMCGIWAGLMGAFRSTSTSAQEPKFNANGVLDLTGVKLRDNPIFHTFFEAMNATTASMPATEVYAALEKGVVDAAAWTSIGLMDLKWDKFMKYRVDPQFYNTDIGVIFNKDSWNDLSPESQALIEEVVIK